MSVSCIVTEKTPVVSSFRLPRVAAAAETVDPVRRLFGAIVLQAVRDAYFPTKQTSQISQQSARQWLMSPEGDYLLRVFLGVPHA